MWRQLPLLPHCRRQHPIRRMNVVYSMARLTARREQPIHSRVVSPVRRARAAMLRRGWMNRYVPPARLALVEDLMTRFGYVWSGMMFVTGALNLVVAVAFTVWWPTFIAVFPLVSKLGLFAVQFAIVRFIGQRRARVGSEPAGSAPKTSAV